MAIEYVEIRDSSREIIGIVDVFSSIIWHSVWFGVGDFEIYAPRTLQSFELLKIGNYVSRNDTDDIGIIERVEYTTSIDNGKMVTATGRFAKSILDRRLIYNLSGKVNKATVLRGRVENAARVLVLNNAIDCSFDARRDINFLELGANANIPAIIVDEQGQAADKQVSYQNLLEYTDGLLEEYGLSAKIILNDDTKKLQYIVKEGIDRSMNNTAGLDAVIFSRDYDNLSASDYSLDTTPLKNVALIGGEGEGTGRFYALLAPAIGGLERRELFVDASSLSQTYKDESEEEHTYTDAEYKAMLITQGKQSLAPLIEAETFSGTIVTTAGNYLLNRDFALGDIVTVQENSIGVYIDVRIKEVTEVQDENGYTVNAVYE